MKTKILPAVAFAKAGLRWGGRTMLLAGLCSIVITSCNDDESKPKNLPEVTTLTITDVTFTTATGGGEINSDGNAEITASGLVYSSVNTMPTIADSKTEESATFGIFTSALEGLTSSTTYYVRAYATNSVGTGYGNVISFTTGNAAPVVTNVAITGDVDIETVLTVVYTYSDAEIDAEGSTIFQWYSANDIAGSGEVAIAGADESTYTILATDEFKYIRVGVTPKAATGTMMGTEMKSAFVGPVPEAPETVTFVYNDKEVTYEVITSSVTGRKWMDRNLGAQRAATGMQDHLAYGDLFQWGREADGHQLITWTQDVLLGSSAPVNGTTATLSTTDVPGHSLFIIGGSDTGTGSDWRDPQNGTMWQAPNYPNSPCPAGWHIPTDEEWGDENIDLTVDNQLKLTANGARRADGNLQNNSSGPGRKGWYWGSTTFFYDVDGRYYASHFAFALASTGGINSNFAWGGSTSLAFGHACRCIKNE